MKVAFTGHRPDKLGGWGADNRIKMNVMLSLEVELVKLAKEHPGDLTCISGMALGFDLWAAETCVDMSIPFIAAVPFDGHDKLWPAHNRKFYDAMVAKAQSIVVVTQGGYAAWKMQRRNQWMVDNSDLLIGAWNGTDGGTANCVRYAESVKHKIILLEW